MEEETITTTNEPVIQENTVDSVVDSTDPSDPVEPTEEIVVSDPTETQNTIDLNSNNTEQETQEVTEQSNDYNEIYSEQLELTNHLIAGQIFFMGLIFGVLLFKIFWDRWKI